MFQFLIGRLKTSIARILKTTFSPFQSLLGRLKTGELFPTEEGALRFQSLLGRLKTGVPVIITNPPN